LNDEEEARAVNAKGALLLIDFYGASAEVLNDAPLIKGIAREVADRVGAQVLEASCHKLHPQGVIVVLTLSQSHLSIHTWPEAGYAAVDLFFCGRDFHTEPSLSEWLCERLQATRFEEWTLQRGGGLSGPSAMSSRHGP
jgi:S-adenosylmethionine decarboxylase